MLDRSSFVTCTNPRPQLSSQRDQSAPSALDRIRHSDSLASQDLSAYAGKENSSGSAAAPLHREEHIPQGIPSELSRNIDIDEVIQGDQIEQAIPKEGHTVQLSLGHVESSEQQKGEVPKDVSDLDSEQDGQPQLSSNESSSNGEDADLVIGPNSVTYASVDAIVKEIGPNLAKALPEMTALYFCEREFEDYFPVRLHIGHCRDDISGILCQLWAYLKPTKNCDAAPHIHYIMGSPMTRDTVKAVQDSVDEENDNVQFSTLSHKLSNDKAELWPLFRPFAKQQLELQALIKYAYVLVAESPEVPLPDHLVPMNQTFMARLRKVCQCLESRPIDYLNRSVSLRLNVQSDDSSRVTDVSVRAAAIAERTGFSDLDKVPAHIMNALQEGTPIASGTPKQQSQSGPTSAKQTELSRAQAHSASSNDGHSITEDSADEIEDDAQASSPDNDLSIALRRHYRAPVLLSSSSSSSSGDSIASSAGTHSPIAIHRTAAQMITSPKQPSKFTRLPMQKAPKKSRHPKTRKYMIK